MASWSRGLVVLVVATACGRVGFDGASVSDSMPSDAASDGATDGSVDTPGEMTPDFAFVQIGFTCMNQITTIDVALPNVQTAGNVNVVAIGVNDLTSNITSITDTAGNTYTTAVPLQASGALRQWMFLASPIASTASNVLTVTFDQSATLVGVIVAEYSGVDTLDPIDATASAGGTNMNSDSGTAIVDGPALLVGVNSNANPGTAGPGPGYTQRVLTDYDDILEDRVVITGGTYRADAPLTTNHAWVMQMLALNPK